MYKVIVRFADIQDGYRIYNPGECFPRDGLQVTPARLAELSSPANRRGVPLIAEIKPVEKELGINTPVEAEKPNDGANTTAEKPKRGRKRKNAE